MNNKLPQEDLASMPFTLNTNASFALTSSTSSGDTWGRAYQIKTTINKDGTTRTKRTQRLGEPIIEETRRWDGKGRRVLEDGSVYEKNGKGKGWVQVQAPTVKTIHNASTGGSRRKGTILGMTCEPSKNVVGNGNGLGNNFVKGGVGKGTENWLNGIMGQVANDALESRGRGRILQEVESEDESEEYTDSAEYTSGEYTSGEYTSSEEEEEEEEVKPRNKKSNQTTQIKSKTGEKKQQKPEKEMEKKNNPTKAKIVQESSSGEEDNEDDDGYEIAEVLSSDEEVSGESEEEDEQGQEQEKQQSKKSVETKPVKKELPKGKHYKKSVAIP